MRKDKEREKQLKTAVLKGLRRPCNKKKRNAGTTERVPSSQNLAERESKGQCYTS